MHQLKACEKISQWAKYKWHFFILLPFPIQCGDLNKAANGHLWIPDDIFFLILKRKYAIHTQKHTNKNKKHLIISQVMVW